MRQVQKAKRATSRQQRLQRNLERRSEKGLTWKILLLALTWFIVGAIVESVAAYRVDLPVARSAFLELGLLCRGDYTNVTVSKTRVFANCGNGDPVIVENFNDR